MGKTNDSWERMLRLLAEYGKKNGHCNVPANWPPNPTLGMWAAAQRHKRKIGRLSAVQIKRLETTGFCWSPCDQAWERMFTALLDFKKRFGHADVPSHWPENRNLSSWVANQRHRRRAKMLSAQRVKRLNEIEFTWSIYRGSKEAPKHGDAAPAMKRAEEKAKPFEERLYNVAAGAYVQYGGKGRQPVDLIRYIKKHDGEFPPYIPLPDRTMTFQIGENYSKRPRKLIWKGKGKLPKEVLEFVNENGHLPSHTL